VFELKTTQRASKSNPKPNQKSAKHHAPKRVLSCAVFLLYLCGPCLTTDTAENRQGKRYRALIFWALFYQEKSARKIGAQAIPPSSQNKAATETQEKKQREQKLKPPSEHRVKGVHPVRAPKQKSVSKQQTSWHSCFTCAAPA
jgi:hypothetical protein